MLAAMRWGLGTVAALAGLALIPGVAAAGTAASITATEAQPLTNVVVDTISSCSPSSLQSITIDWGDATTSSGAAFETNGGCGIAGNHTYAEEGSYITEVSYSFVTGGTGQDAGKAAVADAPVSVGAVNDLAQSAGSPFSGPIANWMDTAPAEALSSYSAAVDWGDGQASAGSVSGDGTVTAGHTYVNGGSFPITVTFHDEGGASAVAHEHAVISGCPAAAPGDPSPSFDPAASALDARWLQGAYHDVLGRAPGTSEMSALLNALSHGQTRRQVALALLGSSEYRQDLVASLYTRYLRRAANSSDLSAGVGALASGGSDESLASTILGSPEYAAARGGNSPDGFLSALYCDALFRSIDQFAQNNDDAALGTGTTRGAIAAGLLGSTEYLSLDVNGAYLRSVRRPASSSERAYWAGLIKGGESDEGVLASLLASTEYYEIFNPKVAFVSALTVHGMTLDTTLSRAAKVTLVVFRFGPHGRASAVTPAPNAKRVGAVNFGLHRKGHLKLRWRRRVHGRPLKRGTYALILRAYKGHRLIGVTDAVHLSIR